MSELQPQPSGKDQNEPTPTAPAVSIDPAQRARELAAQGVAPKEIAIQLGKPYRTVSRWVQLPRQPGEERQTPLRDRVLAAYAAGHTEGKSVDEILSGLNLDKVQRNRARNFLETEGVDVGSRKRKPDQLTQTVMDAAGDHKTLESLLAALQATYPDLTKQKLSEIAGWVRARGHYVPYANEVERKPSQQ